MKVVYIGPFPITGGGVTNKNRDLFEALTKREVKVEKVDLHKITKNKSVLETIKLIFALFNRNNKFIVGISTGKNTRRNFCRLLYIVNRKSMKKSIIFIMGGIDDKNIAEDGTYRKWMSCYKKVYVETIGMKKNLERAGMTNIAIYPNCRFRPQHKFLQDDHSDVLKCVFFSTIQPEKGVDLILEAAKMLPSVQFTFYGNIVPDYQDRFIDSVNALPNADYRGIFRGKSNAIYEELTKYDVLLLPTLWDTEGVPGVLVEGKISGLAEIVSDKSYNAEIVSDGQDGIVLKNNTVEDIVNAIMELKCNTKLLAQMKRKSFDSSDKFYIETYLPDIISDLN